MKFVKKGSYQKNNVSNKFQKKKKSFRNLKSSQSHNHEESRQRKEKDSRKLEKYYSNGSKKFYDTVKEKLFVILGGKICDSCGFRDSRALGFTYKGDPDTFNQIKRGGFAASWGKYISNPDLARKEIQITCLNCNAIREPQIKNSKKEFKKKSKFFPRKRT